MTCKTSYATAESIILLAGATGFWLLDYDTSASNGIRFGLHNAFEQHDNVEKYHSQLSSGSLQGNAKFISTLRYTGRLEDNGKYLRCYRGIGSASSGVIFQNGMVPSVILIVRRKFYRD